MPSRYSVAQICLNGHCITSNADAHPERKQAFCQRCGAKTITACPSCNASIRGEYDYGIAVMGNIYNPPSYCYQCGAPFPWTQTALETAAALIQEDDLLSQESHERLIESLPDIINETPKSRLAAMRLKSFVESAAKFAADAMRQFAIDFACEFVKKQMGL